MLGLKLYNFLYAKEQKIFVVCGGYGGQIKAQLYQFVADIKYLSNFIEKFLANLR